jgi:hypothetical protein
MIMNFAIICISILLMFLPLNYVDAAEENKGEPEKSVFNLDNALSTHTGFKEDFRNQVRILLVRGNHEKPFFDFNNALTPNFKDEGDHFSRGIQQFWNLDTKSAIQEFDKTIAINHNYPRGYYYRGVSLILNDDFEKGWADIKKAQQLGLKINPKMLDMLKRYDSMVGTSKVSPDVENAFDKAQWHL